MKLDTRKLDSLVDLVGELVIAQSMVVQDPEVQRLSSRHLARTLRQLGRITTELQRTAMSLRMVPIRRTFRPLRSCPSYPRIRCHTSSLCALPPRVPQS